MNDILLVNGITENKESASHYYMYDIEKEVFIQERSDRKLTQPYKDRQGNRDFSKGGKVFCQLSEGQVKVFHNSSCYWDVLPLYLIKISKEKLSLTGGCCGKR